jgi:crotonobetainyl-CoA:carnitine CoA-transferase CaiB-like acyl-CoA transferase
MQHMQRIAQSQQKLQTQVHKCFVYDCYDDAYLLIGVLSAHRWRATLGRPPPMASQQQAVEQQQQQQQELHQEVQQHQEEQREPAVAKEELLEILVGMPQRLPRND